MSFRGGCSAGPRTPRPAAARGPAGRDGSLARGWGTEGLRWAPARSAGGHTCPLLRWVLEAASPPAEMGFTGSSGSKRKPRRTGWERKIAVLSNGDRTRVITHNEGEVTGKRDGTAVVSHTHFLCVLLWDFHFILAL